MQESWVFFVDNGILSLLLADDRVLEVRKPEDQGLLVENFFVSEMVKNLAYKGDSLTQLGYLWHDKGEIDLVEYRNGIVRAWEVKLTKKQGGTRETRNALGDASFTLVNLENIVNEKAEKVSRSFFERFSIYLRANIALATT